MAEYGREFPSPSSKVPWLSQFQKSLAGAWASTHWPAARLYVWPLYLMVSTEASVPSVRASFAARCSKLGHTTSTSTVSGAIFEKTRTVCMCQLVAAAIAARERSNSRLGDLARRTNSIAPSAASTPAATIVHFHARRFPEIMGLAVRERPVRSTSNIERRLCLGGIRPED